MATSAVRVQSRTLTRDPVLALPAVVAAGLAIGWLGVHEHVPGTRIAADLGLAWGLVAAFLVVVERSRRRRVGWLLAAAAFAVLVADLQWSSSRALWTAGFVLEGLWVALLAGFVVAVPERGPWSGPARFVIGGAVVATLGAQLAGVLVSPDARGLLSVTRQEGVAHAIDRFQEISGVGLGLVVLVLVVRRLRDVLGMARRSQGPLLVAGAGSAVVGLAWLSLVIANDGSTTTLETVARGTAVSLPVGVLAGILGARLGTSRASDLVVELRRQ